MKHIGLVTGGGTGPELARVFRDAAEAFSTLGGDRVAIAECPHAFRSFTELRGLSQRECRRIVEQDVEGLTTFYREFYSGGGRHLFRTAVNAETLYAVRRQLQAVKVSHATFGNSRISFIRDQFQGFYSNESWSGTEEEISFTASFSREGLQRIYSFTRAETLSWLGLDPEVWFVYKHHLFANSFEQWIHGISPQAIVLQPGMAYSKLTTRAGSGARSLLLIAGNEIGDMLGEIFIGFAGGENRETAWSRNVYLQRDVEGLAEYQTVHGSADDIAGLGRVNPIATLRAAAILFDEELGISGIAHALENAIARAGDSGRHPTEERARRLISDAIGYFQNEREVQPGISKSKRASSSAARAEAAGGSNMES